MNITITSEQGLSDQEKKEYAALWGQLEEEDRLKHFINHHKHDARV
ncbi:MAG: hypothetical protein ABIJ21_04175 [Nanoarchaeota archaeon]